MPAIETRLPEQRTLLIARHATDGDGRTQVGGIGLAVGV
jgi:hypothetical protein